MQSFQQNKFVFLGHETTIHVTPQQRYETEVYLDATEKDKEAEKKQYSSSFYRSTASMKTGQDLGTVDVVLGVQQPKEERR